MERKKSKQILVETAVQIRNLLEQLIAYKMQQEGMTSESLKAAEVAFQIELPVGHLAEPPPGGAGKRRIIHVRDLKLAEGDYLMDTVETLDVLGVSRGTLVSHRDEGLLTEVRIGAKGGGVRFISSEVAKVREWYSVRKGKV